MPARGGPGLRTGVVLSACLLCACGGDVAEPAFDPGEARFLSAGSPTKDEDPSVLRARDGTLFVAWTAPVRVTTNGGGDSYPSLFQDEAGTIHLVWFRWTAPFVGNIWHNSSSDGRNQTTTSDIYLAKKPLGGRGVPARCQQRHRA
jgi:hypothetical protein